jgi:hypothetical protein
VRVTEPYEVPLVQVITLSSSPGQNYQNQLEMPNARWRKVGLTAPAFLKILCSRVRAAEVDRDGSILHVGLDLEIYAPAVTAGVQLV